jgi:xanthine dehydrogenase iron-sulfur cluster and FAD-binding subunit A
VAVGACSAVAQRLSVVEAALRGASVGAVADRVRAEDVEGTLRPIDDVRATGAYRHIAATQLLRRAVALAVA